MIGKLKGIIDSYGEDAIILDVNGVGYLVHCSARTLQALPAPGEPAVAGDRDPCARGPDPAVRLPVRRRARMVPPAADRAGRRHQGRARGAVDAQSGRTRLRHRGARQGDGGAHARRRAEGRRAHRHRTQGQGAGLCQHRSGGGAAVRTDRGPARAAAGRRCGLGARQSRLRSAAGGRRDRGGGARGRRGRGYAEADPAGLEGAWRSDRDGRDFDVE